MWLCTSSHKLTLPDCKPLLDRPQILYWKKIPNSAFAHRVPSRNHCAYVVQRNITCTMQDGVATYVKAEYTTKCIWGQKCPVVMYRTFYKPTYKVGHKTITELEWRCCPGFSGENCHDGSTPLPDGTLPPSKGAVPPHRPGLRGYPHGSRFGGSGVSGERLDRMEDNLRRLTQGLDTLNGMVVSLEDRMRTSLREDTTKILSTLLANSPRLVDSSVGLGVFPEGTGGRLDGVEGFAGLGDLEGRVTEVKNELRAKAHVLEEIQGMVLGHDGQLKSLMEAASGRPVPGSRASVLLEEILDAKLAGVRADILDGFERRLTGLESHCDERIVAVQRQCQREHVDGQEQMQQSLDGRETGIREELGTLQAQIQGLTLTESCCGQVATPLRSTGGIHVVHVETLIEARLVDMEGRLNATDGGLDGLAAVPGGLDGFKTMLEEKLKTLEERVFVAGHLLCTSSCSPSSPVAAGVSGAQAEEECGEVEKKVSGRLDTHSDQLDRLNGTLRNLLLRIAQEETEGSVQGEITLLKVNINSVNRTLKGLRDSVSYIAKEVGHANTTWEQRENQLSNQMLGIARLVGHQATAFGAGERRLAQLKGELVALRRRLSGELQGCRSSTLGVQKEVKDVDSRVSQVEGQCSSLGELAEHLEKIRAELERHSDSYLAQVSGTLSDHSEQLAELKGEIKDCAANVPGQ
uniref:EMI domain-containing protein n=1 Tax=Gadus morhua TaxID=8049 RepID=A0A8C5FA11_GADMO